MSALFGLNERGNVPIALDYTTVTPRGSHDLPSVVSHLNEVAAQRNGDGFVRLLSNEKRLSHNFCLFF